MTDTKQHHCPGCETPWTCDEPTCTISDALCEECDCLEVRQRLGGIWYDE